jgi:SAM-dependent methyltransferase
VAIIFSRDINEANRQAWLKKTLAALPAGVRLLDAGAGELKNRSYCSHLDYVSQDFCQYTGETGAAPNEGLQMAQWDTSRIDLVSDIAAIPAPDESFDAILCSEVLEHVPDPTRALDEFARLLKPGGRLILTAPFASQVHMAPYHYCTGFSRYWYELHLPKRGFEIRELSANGDWFAYAEQELRRLGGMERQVGGWSWPLAYAYSLLGVLYFRLRADRHAADLGCFGWHCVATKQ